MKCLFKDRIKELRIENKLNQSQLAEKCKVKQSCVSKWERGETLPDAQTIILLSEIFNESSDYILGIKDF
ncbi:MAG: helix-turn-helix transcriptional regulator [Clostridiales bacterium]|nr:helix-turn-helix transcriptional regulator [Clostridiales bacterium]